MDRSEDWNTAHQQRLLYRTFYSVNYVDVGLSQGSEKGGPNLTLISDLEVDFLSLMLEISCTVMLPERIRWDVFSVTATARERQRHREILIKIVFTFFVFNLSVPNAWKKKAKCPKINLVSFLWKAYRATDQNQSTDLVAETTITNRREKKIPVWFIKKQMSGRVVNYLDVGNKPAMDNLNSLNVDPSTSKLNNSQLKQLPPSRTLRTISNP